MASADWSTKADQDPNMTSQSDGKEYDAFICFNTADEEFVDDLLKYLESPDIGLKCVDHRRDFHAGKTISGNINEFVESSAKYVLIMSPAFVGSEWCQWETDIMLSMSVEQKRGIIPVLLKPCKIPTALSTLTYIDVRQSDRWRDRLATSITRTDQKDNKHKIRQMEDIIQRAEGREADYKDCVQRYEQNREKFNQEKMVLESKVRIAYDHVSKQISAALELQKVKKLGEILRLMDTRQKPLVQKMNAAEDILKLLNGEKDDQYIDKLDKLQDEYDAQEQKLKQLTIIDFVKSDSLVEMLTDQISKFDVGHLRETGPTLLGSQDGVDNTVEDLGIQPGTANLSRGNTILCPDMRYDEEKVHFHRTILPDGSLLNCEPSEPVTNPDKRLKNFLGAVGTATLAAGGVYYWEGKVDVDLKKGLSNRNFVFVISLSTDGVFDEAQVGDRLPTVISIAARACEAHQAVCLYVTKYACLQYHEVLTQNQSGKWLPIELGFLLDTVRQRLTIYDVTKEGEITLVDKIGDVEEFTPQFAVYAGHAGSVRMSLIKGQDTSLTKAAIIRCT